MSKLASSGLGCFMKCNCFNSIMYADDLIILSISLLHLQSLVDICVHEFKSIGMSINLLKSACLRVGPRHAAVCQLIIIDQVPLKWVQEIKYLGIYLLSGKNFSFNLQPVKQKFFKALNGIFGKIGLKTSPAVLCSLINSYCVPILIYAAEALDWSKKLLNSLENAYANVFYKIFNSYDKKIITQCQFYTGCLPMHLLLDLRKLTFFAKICTKAYYYHPLQHLVKWTNSEYDILCNKYGDGSNVNVNSLKFGMFQHF